MNLVFNEIFNNSQNKLLEQAKLMEKIKDIKILDQPIVKALEANYFGEVREIGDVKYQFDKMGRVNKWEGNPKLTPDNGRDSNSQIEAGGKDREIGDDGGHLLARILGGPSDPENIVAMRAIINRGDYKKAENEIKSALERGEDVKVSGRLFYEGDSKRPSKIELIYTIGKKENKLVIDNVEGSTDLMKDLKGTITKQDFKSLSNEISDIKNDGNNVSITSISKHYDENGKLKSVTVGVMNETEKEKTYKTFSLEG